MGSGLNILMIEFHSLFKYAHGYHHSTLLSIHVVIILFFHLHIIMVGVQQMVPSHHAYPMPPLPYCQT
jgi:hypothetical protein